LTQRAEHGGSGARKKNKNVKIPWARDKRSKAGSANLSTSDVVGPLDRASNRAAPVVHHLQNVRAEVPRRCPESVQECQRFPEVDTTPDHQTQQQQE
jgi:hypothetical protein